MASSLSAIVTPGTIVVQPSIITNKQLLIITQRDFISGMYSTMILITTPPRLVGLHPVRRQQTSLV